MLVVALDARPGRLAGLVRDGREGGGQRRGEAAAPSVLTSSGMMPVASMARRKNVAASEAARRALT